MKIPFELIIGTGGEPVKFELPGVWSDITVKEFVKIKETLNQGKTLHASTLLAIFTEFGESVWENATGDNAAAPLLHIQRFYMNQPPKFMDPSQRGETLTIAGKEILIHPTAGQYPIGVIQLLTDKFTKWAEMGLFEKGTLDEVITFASEVVAYFVYNQYSGNNFDEREARKLIPVIDSMPAVEVIPVASFFLSMHLKALQDGLQHLNPPSPTP